MKNYDPMFGNLFRLVTSFNSFQISCDSNLAVFKRSEDYVLKCISQHFILNNM